MRRRLVFFLVMVMALATTAMAAKKSFTLVIDAGHGGRDAGALGAYSKEKNINLKVALEFGRLVEANCPDVDVIYTRKTDVFVELHQRAEIANKNKADLFVSIHTNALPKGRKAAGLETYTLGMHRAGDNFDVAKRENSVILIEKDYKQHYEGFDPNSSESYIMFEFLQDKNMAQSVELARLVQKRTCAAANRQNKGVKQAGFLVLRETSMPGCLIELGFITTPSEEKFLNTQGGIQQLGRGIYQAFVDYKNKYAKGTTAQYKVPKQETAQAKTPPPVPQEQNNNVEKKKKGDSGKKKTVIEELAEARRKAAAEPVIDKTDEEETAAAAAAEQKEDETPAAAEPPAAEPPAVAPEKAEEPGQEPVFKVQILASEVKLKDDSRLLKGESGVDYYEDGKMYKYTKGASTDYNEIYRLRKTLTEKFPDAFIIAFKNGERTDVRTAIQEFRNNKK